MQRCKTVNLWKSRVFARKRNSFSPYLLGLIVSLLAANHLQAGAVEGIDHSNEMILCLAPNDTSSEGTLQRYERAADGHWVAVGSHWNVLFGRKGLAWGHGLQPEQPGPQKMKNDGKTPTGVFRIGQVLGYGSQLPDGNHGWPYHQVTGQDSWIDDEHLPDFSYQTTDASGKPIPMGMYNHLYTLPNGQSKPTWWDKEKMHLGDAAYTWLVLIEHNYDDPNPDYGNEIFFHIRRGEHYRTAGCTTMKQTDIETLVRWLKPDAHPVLVQLTQSEYNRLHVSWGLPLPDSHL